MTVAAMTQSVAARQLTPDEALEAARTYSGGSTAMKAATRGTATRAIPIYTVSEGNLNTLYVFNSTTAGGGYLIVAADDVAVPVLGYADSGSFDPASMPDNLRAWLTGYSEEIAAAAGSGVTTESPTAFAAHRSDRPDIAPLVKTLWNQNSPYNDLCPELSGTRCPTGCVATAMAQVMKYHSWPETGSGSYSYTDNGQTLSADFGSTTYKWADMLDSYTGSYTQAQASAVATLMYHCGVATEMNYGTDGSASNYYLAAQGLVKYFNYDKGLACLQRRYYPLSEWTGLIYDELAAGRPVLYGGTNNSAGHAFVCDGYQSGDYFHINWGWGGMSDGYFLITALDPENQGIGGSAAGYNQNQDMIVGVQRPVDGSTARPIIYEPGAFNTAQKQYNRSSYVMFTDDVQGFFSGSIGEMTVEYGVSLTDASGNVTYIASHTKVELALNQGVTQYAVLASMFPQSGEYTVRPAFRTVSDGQWHDILVGVGVVSSLKLTATTSSLTFTQIAKTYSLASENLTASQPMIAGQMWNISATVVNNGDSEYFGTLIPILADNNYSVVAYGGAIQADIEPSESLPVEWTCTFTSASGSTPAPGSYTLYICREENETYYIVGSGIAVNVISGTVATSADVSALSITGATGNGSLISPYTFDFTDTSVKATLSSPSGYFASTVAAYIFYDTSTMVKAIGNQYVSIAKGAKADITFNGDLSSLEDGHNYLLVIWNTGAPSGTSGQMSAAWYIRKSATTGIEAVEAPAAITVSPTLVADFTTVSAPEPVSSIELYDTAGSRVAMFTPGETSTSVDLSPLARGLYFVKVSAGGSTSVTRIIKK